MTATSVLRIATYNIHKGVQGIGPRRRLEIHNLGHAIEQFDADIVCLQEVRKLHRREAQHFERWPEMVDNIIPYIGGEEEKSEQEPMKLWGHIEGDKIVNATTPSITAQCFRVPVSDGHTAAVFVSMEKKVSPEEIIRRWTEFRGPAQELELPSAPKQFLHYFTEADRPQAKLDRELEHGMAVSIGRLRPDTQYDYKFVCLSHNTLRGAAGGGVLLAELLAKKGYFD